MADADTIVSAECILRSASGRSLTRSTKPIDAETISEFAPSPETKREATRLLRGLGFDVISSGVTLTLVGEAQRFQDVFGVGLEIGKDPSGGAAWVRSRGEPIIPEELRDLVEAVIFPEPPQYHA